MNLIILTYCLCVKTWKSREYKEVRTYLKRKENTWLGINFSGFLQNQIWIVKATVKKKESSL